MLKGTNMAALFNFIVLSPRNISDYNKLCSIRVKVHQKLSRLLSDYMQKNPEKVGFISKTYF